MSVIEARIVIDAPDDMDVDQLIAMLESTISGINNKKTFINIQETDDAVSISPINISSIRNHNDF